MSDLPFSDPERGDGRGIFDPGNLDRTVIAIPLLRQLRADRESGGKPRLYDLVIDLNFGYRDGVPEGRIRAAERIRDAIERTGNRPGQGVDEVKSEFSRQYLFARLDGPTIEELVRLDDAARPAVRAEGPTSGTSHRTIYRVWPDFPVRALTNRSIATVKADAAAAAFAALGDGIVWAVVDSGVDRTHPHFAKHRNLDLDPAIKHRDFTRTGPDADPFDDAFGHGTHVAGILAGELTATKRKPIRAFSRRRDEHGDTDWELIDLPRISGMAPKCRIVSIKVLDENGDGLASSLIAAMEDIRRINSYGRRLLIHGVNLSVGYEFEPEWFACGQSPLCVEVDQLVRSGVVVVVASGNTGYGWNQDYRKGAVAAGLDLTINDPGNAELGITVGSTHRDMPHVYGVSYFSSKGPTGDGRLKPDLVAPGEKILSCAAGTKLSDARGAVGDVAYVEDSGTSMAAPHVSGVIAAFLSIRQEFVGKPEAVKDIFLNTATDLRRDVNFQGRGLVDLMRAIQSV
ncbi:S8 family peptidase [Cryptosporangium sp. NPDC048952]|uniref:S8 family peptidase n=1 Tax=Cryptosporangium sp. NPDC048952 TaxID=3363961 RepID=UPI003717B544